MTEIAVKHDRIRIPLRMSSFYELYKRFLKDHGCKWHDVAKLLNVVAEILFDVDGACTKISGKINGRCMIAPVHYSYSWPAHVKSGIVQFHTRSTDPISNRLPIDRIVLALGPNAFAKEKLCYGHE
ncbi:jg19976 [Pararge aegeria aegeria]|uniref:Jg19976 protein n=1 Tax=Pararge aegeria aegeria TaxID=348720 RepID=A0A8S4RVT4_9NEOP|nr:jg19976 [Pararge aegeria aegeria]